MRKICIAALAAVWLAGCSAKDDDAKVGIGVVPLNGATVTGQVVEASKPSGVLVKTASDRSFLLPDSWEYRKDGKPVAVKNLTPGSQITAVAPPVDSRLVSAADNTLVLESEQGFFSFPVEGLAPAAQTIPVRVQTTGGQYSEMPLGRAMENYPGNVMSHPYYQDYEFPQADPYSVSKGLAVGSYMNAPMMLAPTSQGVGLMTLPPSYPASDLMSHQPVRFSYADNNVAVSSWDSLTDGQFGLEEVLLAGTLLDVLPGQAVIQVGQSPVTVPWSYVTYNGAPIGQTRYPVGTPVGVHYYPGVYDSVAYDNDNMTFMYHDQAVQMPIDCLPQNAYSHRVRVKRPKGQWVSMPFQAAQPLLDSGGYWMAPSQVAMPYVENWKHQKPWKSRKLRGMPGYQLVGRSGGGPAYAVRTDGRRQRQRNDWWAYNPDWNYTVASMAGPAAWNVGQSLVRVPPYQAYGGRDRHRGPQNVAWNGHRGQPKHDWDKGHKRTWGNQNIAWNGNRSQPKHDWDKDRKRNRGNQNVAWNGNRSQPKPNWDQDRKRHRGNQNVAWNGNRSQPKHNWDQDRKRNRGNQNVAWNGNRSKPQQANNRQRSRGNENVAWTGHRSKPQQQRVRDSGRRQRSSSWTSGNSKSYGVGARQGGGRQGGGRHSETRGGGRQGGGEGRGGRGHR